MLVVDVSVAILVDGVINSGVIVVLSVVVVVSVVEVVGWFVVEGLVVIVAPVVGVVMGLVDVDAAVVVVV